MISNFDNEFIIEEVLKGLDFLLKYKNKQLYLWTVYSLGIIQRYDEGNVYFPHFDRRHNVNFVSSFHLVIIIVGKRRSLESWVRISIHTDSGYYENIPFTGGINARLYNSKWRVRCNMQQVKSRKTSLLHRLDLSLSKTFEISKNTI